jgi:hypothetical protein
MVSRPLQDRETSVRQFRSERLHRYPRIAVHLGEKQASHFAAQRQRLAQCFFDCPSGPFANPSIHRQRSLTGGSEPGEASAGERRR